MFGYVSLGGPDRRVVLEDDWTWTSSEYPEHAQLALLLFPRAGYNPVDGNPGVAAIADLAHLLGGEPVYDSVGSLEPGRIY